MTFATQQTWSITQNRWIFKVEGAAVPQPIRDLLRISIFGYGYLNSSGYWSKDFDSALNTITAQPIETFIHGHNLSWFVPPEWAIDNGNPEPERIYRVWPLNSYSWNAAVWEPA